jgi:hypothetical protein
MNYFENFGKVTAIFMSAFSLRPDDQLKPIDNGNYRRGLEI